MLKSYCKHTWSIGTTQQNRASSFRGQELGYKIIGGPSTPLEPFLRVPMLVDFNACKCLYMQNDKVSSVGWQMADTRQVAVSYTLRFDRRPNFRTSTAANDGLSNHAIHCSKATATARKAIN